MDLLSRMKIAMMAKKKLGSMGKAAMPSGKPMGPVDSMTKKQMNQLPIKKMA